MISYSRRDMRHQLVSDRRLWKRLPGSAAAVLWPLETILLGWDTARWAGPATVAVVVVLATLLPPRLSISVYVVDLLDQLLRLPLWLVWLLLVWHLSVREPIFQVIGSPPIAGAILATALAWLLARVITLIVGLAVRHFFPRGDTASA